jgi:prepilin-type N-terminal cleavage/methylation domain-containing protein
MRRPPPSPRNRRAFTLVELLVVIGILAVIAGGIIVVYDGVQEHAGEQLTTQRMQTVRAALLKFRADMGYFPGDGPLAPAQLDLSGFYYVDGESPGTENPAAPVRQAWAAHALNFWMLYEKPPDAGDSALPSGQPKRWDFKKESARGWDGPYLGAGFSFRLDGAGTLAGAFASGTRSNRLYAVGDALTKKRGTGTHLQWVSEDRPPTQSGLPDKQPQDDLGRPLAFLKDTAAAPGFTLYVLVAAGRDGIYTLAAPYGDDVRVEVARQPL